MPIGIQSPKCTFSNEDFSMSFDAFLMNQNFSERYLSALCNAIVQDWFGAEIMKRHAKNTSFPMVMMTCRSGAPPLLHQIVCHFYGTILVYACVTYSSFSVIGSELQKLVFSPHPMGISTPTDGLFESFSTTAGSNRSALQG